MALESIELLARTIQCEAGGEGDTGMRAVACVIMNRVNVSYGEYGRLEKTIRGIIYQPGQFDCVRETIGGRYNPQNVYNMRPEQQHYDIANWAIAGNRLTQPRFRTVVFQCHLLPTCRRNFPSDVGVFVIRIGDHCFYNPTAAYADT